MVVADINHLDGGNSIEIQGFLSGWSKHRDRLDHKPPPTVQIDTELSCTIALERVDTARELVALGKSGDGRKIV
jgi:hypothetical protein